MIKSDNEQTSLIDSIPLVSGESVLHHLSTEQSIDSNNVSNVSNERLTKKRKNESKEEDAPRLWYHTRHGDIFELQKFIRELSDEAILKNHKIAMLYTNTNIELTNPSACGLTAQSILNILVENQGSTIKDTMCQNTFDSNLLSDYNIVHVDVTSCTCCDFPGHALVIYCSNYMCAVIQSYVNVYTHRDFFDVLPVERVIKYVKSLQSMCINGMNTHAVKQLSKITHVDHTELSSCMMRGTEFRIRYFKSNTKFSI